MLFEKKRDTRTLRELTYEAPHIYAHSISKVRICHFDFFYYYYYYYHFSLVCGIGKPQKRIWISSSKTKVVAERRYVHEWLEAVKVRFQLAKWRPIRILDNTISSRYLLTVSMIIYKTHSNRVWVLLFSIDFFVFYWFCCFPFECQVKQL